MSWLPPPVRPLTEDCVQLAPSAEVQTTADRSLPGGPNWPAEGKPSAPAASAVMVVSGPGELNGTCCQVLPPSVDSSTRGDRPAEVVCWPVATTRFPSIATWYITAAEAVGGNGRLRVVQVRPSAVVHTTGLPS